MAGRLRGSNQGLVYKIPYRRARTWPRPSASREQRYLAYKSRARLDIRCIPLYSRASARLMCPVVSRSNQGWADKYKIALWAKVYVSRAITNYFGPHAIISVRGHGKISNMCPVGDYFGPRAKDDKAYSEIAVV